MSQVQGKRPMPWVLCEFQRVLASDGRALLAGLPALSAAAAALVLAYILSSTTEDQLVYRYFREASRRTEARDLDTALVCYERLARETGSRPEIRFQQALALEAKGDRDQARSILDQLAPNNRQGFMPAHMKLARSLLAGDDRSERTLRVVELHLKYALRGPDSIEANSLLGRLYAGMGKPEEAETYLLKAAPQHPELLLTLAGIARGQGKEPMARERAEHARRVFQKKAEEQIDDPEARLNWVRATLFGQDYAGAVAILERGLRLTGDPRYSSALGQVFVLWADALGRDGKSTLRDLLALLERGLKYDPRNTDLLDRLAAVLRGGGPDADRVRMTLQALLADGKATAWVHFMLGVDATTRGRDDEAKLHWEQAFRLEPSLAVVANNLAWLLANSEPPDLNRALELVNQAIERKPKDARFHGTRGVVLMKLGRWSEALTELEVELAAFPDGPVLHRRLAEVYDHLGSPELASTHRSRAEARDKAGK